MEGKKLSAEEALRILAGSERLGLSWEPPSGPRKESGGTKIVLVNPDGEAWSFDLEEWRQDERQANGLKGSKSSAGGRSES